MKSWLVLSTSLLFRAMVSWLRQTAHDQEVVGSNPGTIYWMDVSDDSYYININVHENNKNKGSQKGHTKKICKKSLIVITSYKSSHSLLLFKQYKVFYHLVNVFSLK